MNAECRLEGRYATGLESSLGADQCIAVVLSSFWMLLK